MRLISDNYIYHMNLVQPKIFNLNVPQSLIPSKQFMQPSHENHFNVNIKLIFWNGGTNCFSEISNRNTLRKKPTRYMQYTKNLNDYFKMILTTT